MESQVQRMPIQGDRPPLSCHLRRLGTHLRPPGPECVSYGVSDASPDLAGESWPPSRPGPSPNSRTHPVEGGSANDYDYAAGDPVNGLDLGGNFCVTGVARHVTELRYNHINSHVKIRRVEVCRSVARGFLRAVDNISFENMFRACAVEAATSAPVGAIAGPEAAAGAAALGCVAGAVYQFLKDGGVDRHVVENIDRLIDVFDLGKAVRKASKGPIERFIIDESI